MKINFLKSNKPFNMTFLILIAFIFCITGCANQTDISQVNRKIEETLVYKKEDINKAMDVVILDFKENYEGCTLIDIWNDNSKDNTREEDMYKERYKLKNIMIIHTNFKTGINAPTGLTSQNSYNDYVWILAKNNHNEWTIQDKGFQ